MKRRTERSLTLGLLALTLIVAVTALVRLHENSRLFIAQQQHLQTALSESIETACIDPERAKVEKLKRCEEALGGLDAEKDRLEQWIAELQQASTESRSDIQHHLDQAAKREEKALVQLSSLEGTLGEVATKTGNIDERSAAHDGVLDGLARALRLPDCPEGPACHPASLGSLANALDRELGELRSRFDSELSLETEGAFAHQLYDQMETQRTSQERLMEQWIAAVRAYEDQVRELQSVTTERDRLRTVLAEGLAATSEVTWVDSDSFAVSIEPPPIDSYRCADLEMVAQLLDPKLTEEQLLPIPEGLCRTLGGIGYQCGRLGGEHTTLALWATYQQVSSSSRPRCQATIDLPKALVSEVGGDGSLKLRIGVHQRRRQGPVTLRPQP